MNAATIAGLLAQASLRLREAGVEETHLEAQMLLAHALGITRTRLLTILSEAPPPTASALFEEYVGRRTRREPTAYIIRAREFYGLEIAVGPAVLIPRPETEQLVEIAIERAARLDRPRIADVGTGSGAVAIAVATSVANARIVATDDSRGALCMATANAAAHGVADRIRFVETDLLGDEGPFNVILANLPYVSEAQWPHLEPEVRDWEPREALVSGGAGTESNERLLAVAGAHLAQRGLLAAEFGAGQADRLREVAGGFFRDAEIVVRTDLAGNERVLVVKT